VTVAAGRLVRALEAAVETYVREACGQRAAAISYHVLFSLVPFVALLVSVLELVLPGSTHERIASWLVEALPLPSDVAESVEHAIEEPEPPPATFAGLIALLALLWTASGMMASVRSAFGAVWGAGAERPYLRGKLLDAGLLLAAGVLVVSAFGLTVVVQLATETGTEIVNELGREGSGVEALGSVAELVGSFVLALLAFLLLYRVAPPVPVRTRDVLPGAVVAAIGFHLGSAGFAVYLRYFADFDQVYGPLGAVLAFLTLVYLAAAVLLFGAAIAAAWPAAGQPPSRSTPAVSLRRRLVRALRGLVVRSG
jgi:membrane protein